MRIGILNKELNKLVASVPGKSLTVKKGYPLNKFAYVVLEEGKNPKAYTYNSQTDSVEYDESYVEPISKGKIIAEYITQKDRSNKLLTSLLYDLYGEFAFYYRESSFELELDFYEMCEQEYIIRASVFSNLNKCAASGLVKSFKEILLMLAQPQNKYHDFLTTDVLNYFIEKLDNFMEQ